MDSRSDQADSQAYTDMYARTSMGSNPAYQRHTSGIRYSGVRAGANLFCLGPEAHPVKTEEAVCSLCGYLAAGAQLGVYQVQRLLGSGRGGHAYLALHVRSKQQVVLKLFPPDPMSAGLWEAARQEARAAAMLNHSAILPVSSCTHWQPSHQPPQQRPLHELMTAYSGNEPYLLTLCQYTHANLEQFVTYYERRETQQALQARGISLRAHLVTLIQQMGSALSAAHGRNLVHGALTPGNILLDGRDRLWIADFGLARLHPPFEPYLAPELQMVVQRGAQVGHWQDFWQIVTPANDQYMLAQICQMLFTRLLRPGEYEQAMPILQSATQSQPERRFSNIDIFLHELLTQLQGANGRSFPASRANSMSGIGNTGPALMARGLAGRGSNPAHAPLTTAGGYNRSSSPSWASPITGGYSNPRSTTSASSLSQADLEQYEKMLNYDLASSQPPSPVDEWEKRGGKLFTEHDFAGAVRAYRQALALDNYRSTLWLALGDAHFALEQYQEALSAYEQALQLNPNDAQGWMNRGTVLDSLGRRQEALECYERADQLEA